jgi:Protein of unknown function (DUF3224)
MMIEPLLSPRDTRIIWVRGASAVALCLLLFVVAAAAAGRDQVMSEHVAGTFDVKVAPVAGTAPDAAFGQMSIDKVFHGDLEGTSKGLMLTAGDLKTGEAGYVAMEKVTGALKGRVGSFVFMHHATMSGGAVSLTVETVPGSGTDALKGIAGTMIIRMDGGKHTYDFAYTLPG